MNNSCIFCNEWAICADHKVATNEAMEETPCVRVNKNTLRDMLSGFRVLSAQSEDQTAFEAVTKWLKLYLKMQNAVINMLDSRCLFEKTVVIAVPYIVSFLEPRQASPDRDYFELLQMLYSLLTNTESSTLATLADSKTRIITTLWRSIGFVGDYNTQAIVMKLIAMLMKYLDPEQQQRVISMMTSSQTETIREMLSNAVILPNYELSFLDKSVRRLLNYYNMQFARHVRVYSLACKTVRLGTSCYFSKPTAAQVFWIDLNYHPRTLTFSGDYMNENRQSSTHVSVALKICQITLSNRTYCTMIIHFDEPAKFSKKLWNLSELQSVNAAVIQLSEEVYQEVRDNNLVLNYFNLVMPHNALSADNMAMGSTESLAVIDGPQSFVVNRTIDAGKEQTILSSSYFLSDFQKNTSTPTEEASQDHIEPELPPPSLHPTTSMQGGLKPTSLPKTHYPNKRPHPNQELQEKSAQRTNRTKLPPSTLREVENNWLDVSDQLLITNANIPQESLEAATPKLKLRRSERLAALQLRAREKSDAALILGKIPGLERSELDTAAENDASSASGSIPKTRRRKRNRRKAKPKLPANTDSNTKATKGTQASRNPKGLSKSSSNVQQTSMLNETFNVSRSSNSDRQDDVIMTQNTPRSNAAESGQQQRQSEIGDLEDQDLYGTLNNNLYDDDRGCNLENASTEIQMPRIAASTPIRRTNLGLRISPVRALPRPFFIDESEVANTMIEDIQSQEQNSHAQDVFISQAREAGERMERVFSTMINKIERKLTEHLSTVVQPFWEQCFDMFSLEYCNEMRNYNQA